MKRRHFLISSLAARLLAKSPTSADDRAKKAVFVASGTNRVNETFGAGQPNLLKLSGNGTNGYLCMTTQK